MKKIILFCLLFSAISFPQSGYTVEIIKKELWWSSMETWRVELEAIIKYNGYTIPNSIYFYYEWWYDYQGYWELFESGNGLSITDSDDYLNEVQYWYVIVSDVVNHTFTNITSDVITVQLNGEPKLVGFYGKHSGNEISEVVPYHWRYTLDEWKLRYNGFLTLDRNETIHSLPFFVDSYNYKFNHWNTDLTEVLNFNTFHISSSVDNLTSRYNNVYDATLNSVIDGYQAGKILFQDPWLIDETDPNYYVYPYGYRNLGMLAPFDEVENGTNNVGINTKYKGVFLNQGWPGWDPPYYSVEAPTSIYLTETGKIHNLYLQNWGGTEVQFKNSNAIETGVVFQDNIQGVDPIAQANLKGTQLSDDTDAYLNNSQRKFIKTPNGMMYVTYESMGYVWLERSTNNGADWEIMNDGKPIGNAEGISPCLDFNRDANYVVLSYQQKIGSLYKLKYMVYDPLWDNYRYGDVEWDVNPMESLSYSHDAKMVIAWCRYNEALFVWKGSNQILYSLCYLVYANTTWYEEGAGSFGNSNNHTPTLYATKTTYQPVRYFHLAYQVSDIDIHYRLLEWHPGSNPYFRVGNFFNVSQNSGYSQNYSPSITGKTENDGDEIKLTWVGYRDAYIDGPPGGGALPAGETKVLFRSRSVPGYWSLFHVYGNNVESVNINKTSEEGFGIGWSQVNGSAITNHYVRSGNLNSIRNLNTTGKDIQVNNSSNFYDMFLNSFQSVTLPYSFSISNNFMSIINKEQISIIYQGREGVVTKDTAQFYFAIGDIMLNGESIDFVELADSVIIEGEQMLNSYLISNPLTVNNTSSLTYGVQYGITDSALAVAALSDGSTINFKVELIDNQTGEIIGSFDDITYSEGNIFQYNNIGYQVDMSGIGNRTVKFKLTVSTNAVCDYSLSKRYADESLLAKTGYKQVTYKGSLAVEDYALAQNYPNPFNPSTTIKYQLPTSGNVTLKIYDILGSEIATLVDNVQNEGRYEVNFNASKLASGVYLYRLQVNDYVNTKKMILLK